MRNRYPLYVVSKGRWESRLTVKALVAMGAEFHVVIESQEWESYAAVIDPRRLLVLDPAYKRDYDAFDALGDSKSKGPGPARNFAWDHSLSLGAERHWVMDDNISGFSRLNRNSKPVVNTPAFFLAMEEWCDRYENVAMAGPNYDMFTPVKEKQLPLIFNTRIYSCNLIRGDLPYRWRGRYNEDTDLSLRMLKDGWVTVQFNAFVQRKIATQKIKGGNTKEFYAAEGTVEKSRMQVAMHPDVSRTKHRFNRAHHYVDYRPFAGNKLIRREGLEIPEGVNELGMGLLVKEQPTTPLVQALVGGYSGPRVYTVGENGPEIVRNDG